MTRPSHAVATVAVDLERCCSYVLNRQTAAGGFCFYTCPEWGIEEPNALDTYCAVAVLRILGRPVPNRSACLAWIKGLQRADGGFPTPVIGHAALTVLKWFDEPPDQDPNAYLEELGASIAATRFDTWDPGGWLASALRCVELRRDYGLPASAEVLGTVCRALGRLRAESGGYGAPGASLPQTGLAVALAEALGMPLSRDALAYARLCEGSPHGFNITSTAISSSLEAVYAGVSIVRAFGEWPLWPGLLSRIRGRLPDFDRRLWESSRGDRWTRQHAVGGEDHSIAGVGSNGAVGVRVVRRLGIVVLDQRIGDLDPSAVCGSKKIPVAKNV